MVARSPYSAWVKVTADAWGERLGGVGGLGHARQCERAPVDNTVPVPETIVVEPTRPAGSFGNAFPDPNAPSF
ncbi:MAG UNVERIFIED_CONTAM: hypothetical protein LVT10_00955 [Anaerolineae bacterium]